MTLHAKVYKNAANLTIDPNDLLFLTINEDSGDLDFTDNDISDKYDVELLGAYGFLGNIATVRHIRTFLESKAFDQSRLIREKVVYNGVHGGDSIPRPEMDAIRDEINGLLVLRGQDEFVDWFLNQMLTLCAASQEEGNPIVF